MPKHTKKQTKPTAPALAMFNLLLAASKFTDQCVEAVKTAAAERPNTWHVRFRIHDEPDPMKLAVMTSIAATRRLRKDHQIDPHISILTSADDGTVIMDLFPTKEFYEQLFKAVTGHAPGPNAPVDAWI